MATLIAFKEGLNHPAFGVALTLAFIVVLDAASLRKQVGRQAAALNRVSKAVNLSSDLRERVGHTLVEIIAGIAVGVAVALVISRI
jgi:acid phosphatase family membrane protein YuiD